MASSAFAAYGEVTITSAGVPVVLSHYPSADPLADTVLFLPGTMVHPLFYDSFLCRIAGAGFRVVGLHFLSHGRSPRVNECFVFDDLVQNGRDAIGYCAERFAGSVVLLGSSQGGIVATALAGDPRIKAVFAHDTILPEMDETVELIRLPRWLHGTAGLLRAALRLAARLRPGYQVPITAYLEPDRITRDEAIIARFRDDPLCRKSYPLSFIASLFNASLPTATDGSIKIPFILIAATEDPLFGLDYICKVYDALVAPEKELMLFELPFHILLIEAETEVAAAVIARLHSLS